MMNLGCAEAQKVRAPFGGGAAPPGEGATAEGRVICTY